MDERAALALVAAHVDGAGDDCAIVDDLAVTTDVLHETTDFPAGTTRYTAGWRAVGASLSDVAAMGAEPVAAVAAYAAPSFRESELTAFLEGCVDVCETVGAAYVGGDLDGHAEFTVASTAVGRGESFVYRSGARSGDAVCVTGTLGRTAAAIRLFADGDVDRANELFRFRPRVATGRHLADVATAMMDSSDGLARSLHQLADASGCGFDIDAETLPIDSSVDAVAADAAERRELGVHYGEDFELVFTLPREALSSVAAGAPTEVCEIGRVTDGADVTLDGAALPDRGFTHHDSGG